MRFSVLIPVYNTAEYLDKCLNSVMHQTFGDFEAIVVDDGSTDGISSEICDKYSAKDSRIKVYHRENHGLLLTRRYSLSKAMGEYILFLDSDDWWELNTLEAISEEIEKFNPDMIIFRYRAVTEFREIEGEALYKKTEPITNKGKLLNYIVCEKTNNIWTKCVKRSVVNNNDYEEYADVSLGEDLLQVIPLFENSNRILYMNKILYNYRINNTSMVHRSFNMGIFRSYMKVSQYVDEYISKSEPTEKKLLAEHDSVVAKKTVKMIKDTALLTIDYSDKLKIYDSMQSDKYFCEVMKHTDIKSLDGKMTRIIYCLFAKKIYRLLILCARLFNIPQRVKNSIKRLLGTVKKRSVNE